MPIIVAMAHSHESDQSNAAGGAESPQGDPSGANAEPGTTPVLDGITPEKLKQVMGRLESGFYDAPDVREQIARKVRKELDL